MYCSLCGTEAPMGALYCHKCGSQLNAEAPPNRVEALASATAASVVVPVVPKSEKHEFFYKPAPQNWRWLGPPELWFALVVVAWIGSTISVVLPAVQGVAPHEGTGPFVLLSALLGYAWMKDLKQPMAWVGAVAGLLLAVTFIGLAANFAGVAKP